MDAVLTASRTLVAVATQSLGAAAEDTTIAQYRALVVLASRGPQRMSDLAAALDVTPSTAGRMCDRLLRKGLIRRHRARADRRAVQVSVTAFGRQVVDQATARRRALIADILRRLPDRQQSAVASALAAFAAAAGEIPDSQWPADPRPRQLRRRRRLPGGNGSRRVPAAHRDDHDGRDGGGHAAGNSAVGRPGGRVAAGLTGRAAGGCARGGRRVRAGRGRVPGPDLLLHLAGHRSRPIRPARPGRQCPLPLARPGVLHRDTGHRRADLRADDLPVRP